MANPLVGIDMLSVICKINFNYFMQMSHWSRLCNRPYDPRAGCKSRRVVEKKAQKC